MISPKQEKELRELRNKWSNRCVALIEMGMNDVSNMDDLLYEFQQELIPQIQQILSENTEDDKAFYVLALQEQSKMIDKDIAESMDELLQTTGTSGRKTMTTENLEEIADELTDEIRILLTNKCSEIVHELAITGLMQKYSPEIKHLINRKFNRHIHPDSKLVEEIKQLPLRRDKEHSFIQLGDTRLFIGEKALITICDYLLQFSQEGK